MDFVVKLLNYGVSFIAIKMNLYSVNLVWNILRFRFGFKKKEKALKIIKHKKRLAVT